MPQIYADYYKTTSFPSIFLFNQRILVMNFGAKAHDIGADITARPNFLINTIK